MRRSPLAGVDANLLVALDAILVDENVGRAARRVGLSASAMSHALARLRQLLGDPILVRSGRRMVATPRARELAGPLREGLALVERAIAPPSPFDPAKEARLLRISALDFAQNQLLPGLLSVLRRDAPGVDVAVAPFEPRVFADLGAGELDLVLAMTKPDMPFLHRVLAEQPFVSMVRRGHPALARRMTPELFASLPHVLISPSGRATGAVDRALRSVGLKRRVALLVPSFTAATIAVSQSDMVLTGAAREAERFREPMGLELFPPPVDVPPFKIGMYWHERHEHDPFLAWVRARVVETAR